MTDNNHPITPPPELVQQWTEYAGLVGINEYLLIRLATQAARWGADQELEACCEHLKRSMCPRATIDYLRAAMRPESPSLKEQALQALKHAEEGWRPVPEDIDIIRRALEQLDD